MVERYWSDGRWVYPEPAEPEEFGPDLIDWLEELREDWRAGLPALFAGMRLALAAALGGVLEDGARSSTWLTLRAVFLVGPVRIFMALAMIGYALVMFAVFDAILLEPLGLGILPR